MRQIGMVSAMQSHERRASCADQRIELTLYPIVIVTRSRAKTNPARYTRTPFPIKCLKLILKELQTFKSSAGGKGKKVSSGTIDVEDDDGVGRPPSTGPRSRHDGADVDQDDEWDDDDDLAGPEGKGEFDFLSCELIALPLSLCSTYPDWTDTAAWLDEGGGGDMEAQDDDEDLRSDPVAQTDMVVRARDMSLSNASLGSLG